MPGPYRIEGYAIVSEDGMLANAAGVMPDALRIDADQRFFSDSLDRVDLIVHGRQSHEGQPNSPKRRRLIVTRTVAGLASSSEHPHAMLWNPAGAGFEQVCTEIGLTAGAVAIIGGTDIFGMFLGRYDTFHLSRAANVRLPGGRPLFPQVPSDSPQAVLSAHGLKAGPMRELDRSAGATLVSWTR